MTTSESLESVKQNFYPCEFKTISGSEYEIFADSVVRIDSFGNRGRYSAQVVYFDENNENQKEVIEKIQRKSYSRVSVSYEPNTITFLLSENNSKEKFEAFFTKIPSPGLNPFGFSFGSNSGVLEKIYIGQEIVELMKGE